MAGKNIFNTVKMTKPGRNHFDLTHDVKLSFNMGELVPVCCFETVPGDSFNISMESLIRFAPLVSPVMHRFDVTCHYFFVPNRIVWPGWENFIMNQENPSEINGTIPSAPFLNWDPTEIQADPAQHRLGNYLGLPIGPMTGTTVEPVNALPFAAYERIWFEYYRDQNLQDGPNGGVPFFLDNGDNSGEFGQALGNLRQRCWEHDYYTSSLPFAQKGAAVSMPLGDVVLKDTPVNSQLIVNPATGAPLIIAGDVLHSNAGVLQSDAGGAPANVSIDPNGSWEVGPTTINDLRRAFRLQEWLEKNARGGTRYIESILSHFGVRSSDKRLQRPEYITGVKSPVTISEVLQTGESGTTPQGNMTGHGVGVTSGNYGKYFCEEHGYIIGIMSVMPKTAYQQGIPKHFLKITDMLDYYWPTFAHLGEQEVLGKEVYAFEPSAYGDEAFGYVPRYAEYRFVQNRVAGDFAGNLNFWHAGRIFSNAPTLNDAFVESDPTHRIFAVTDPDEQKMYAHVLNKIGAVRPMPKFGTPGF